MKVNQLIREFKKLPGNLEIGMTAHDNTEWEVGVGWVGSVHVYSKCDFDTDELGISGLDLQMFRDLPKKWAVIRP